MLQKNASGYSIPIFFSETGCNTPKPRTFDDQAAIFGNEMADTWSGSIIYEWIQEANDYGLISYGPQVDPAATASTLLDGYSRVGTPTPISPDFGNLSKQWATLSPSGVAANAYTPDVTPPPCPAFTSGFWEVSGNAPLPTIGAEGLKYTTGLPATGGAQTGSASSTTASSAASATRGPSASLGRKESGSAWSWVKGWSWTVYAAAALGCLFMIGHGI